jgi:hypothetical protein
MTAKLRSGLLKGWLECLNMSAGKLYLNKFSVIDCNLKKMYMTDLLMCFYVPIMQISSQSSVDEL